MRLMSAVLVLTVAIVTLGSAQQVEVDVGFNNWGLDGNQSKFQQYATPAKSLFLRSLQLSPSVRLFGDAAKAVLKGLGEDDYKTESTLDLWFGRARANLDLSRNRFFDASPFTVGQSQREVQESTVKYLLTTDFAFSLRYRMDRQDHLFEAPKLPLYQRTRFWDAIAEGKLGDGQIHLSYADWRYFDRTDIRPDTYVKRWNFRYLWEPATSFGLESAIGRLSIKQPGRPNSDVDFLALSADWSISSSTDFSLHLRRDKLDLPVVQNAWVRERRIGIANLTHRWRGWNLNFGFRQQESERIRKDQTFVDTPRWRTFEVRLSGRIAPNWRLTLRGNTQHLTHPPTMVTTDPRQLFWDDRRSAQLRLEGGSPILNGYLALTHRRWDNDVRAIELTTNSIVIGGSWQASNRLNLFAEYAYEAWRAKSEMTQFPTLDNFVPNSRVTTIGLSWAIDKRTFLSAAFSEFVTHNDNPLLLRDGNYRGRFLTANLRYRFPAGYEITLTVAPWRYRDRVVDLMDYDATIVMVSGSARF
ncbi:MAG: hypothetical protein NZ805_04405 [Armatimonadetes bacterium]|nr:hypothetical protein [Armatimonadota bacterium]MDW8027957.1 hypothetical protein [Armatimonadota bacterium]